MCELFAFVYTYRVASAFLRQEIHYTWQSAKKLLINSEKYIMLIIKTVCNIPSEPWLWFYYGKHAKMHMMMLSKDTRRNARVV